jgi:hypothetical protein
VLGHDWGRPVAWLLAGWHPQLVRSLTILNGPHPSVFIDELRHEEQQNRSSYMLFFDTKAANLMDPASMFSGDEWFDQTTKAAYAAAYDVPGSREAGLNWYRANVFAGKLNVLHFSSGMPSTLPANLTISPPTLVIWGMVDTAFDNEQNLARLPPLVPQLTIKKYKSKCLPSSEGLTCQCAAARECWSCLTSSGSFRFACMRRDLSSHAGAQSTAWGAGPGTRMYRTGWRRPECIALGDMC